MEFLINEKTYIPISNSAVDTITINIIVILLSFEKFLSQYSASKPIVPNKIPEIPIYLPIKKSKHVPNIKPKINPNFFPANRPTKTINITNKFGIIPAILNHVKKFDCKKYIIKNATTINITDIVFFKFSPSYLFVITSTVSSFVKSTAGSIIAYLSVMFCVFTISDIVPM